jgi:hypothetical protein
MAKEDGGRKGQGIHVFGACSVNLNSPVSMGPKVDKRRVPCHLEPVPRIELQPLKEPEYRRFGEALERATAGSPQSQVFP